MIATIENEEFNELTKPLRDFSVKWLAKYRRKIETSDIPLHDIAKKAQELALPETLKGGFRDNVSLKPSQVAKIIQTLAEGDAAIAYYLLSFFPRYILENCLGCSLEEAAVLPGEGFSFLLSENPIRDVITIHRDHSSLHIVRLKGEELIPLRFVGFRGLPFVRCSRFNIKEIVVDISRDSYQRFIIEVSLFYQLIFAGLLKSSIQYAHSYTKERIAFGKPIIRFQAISHKLANMAIAYETAITFLQRIIENRWISTTLQEVLLSQALFCKESDAILQGAVQTLGGHGYLEDHPVEKWMRDGQILKMMLLELSHIAREVYG